MVGNTYDSWLKHPVAYVYFIELMPHWASPEFPLLSVNDADMHECLRFTVLISALLDQVEVADFGHRCFLILDPAGSCQEHTPFLQPSHRYASVF